MTINLDAPEMRATRKKEWKAEAYRIFDEISFF